MTDRPDPAAIARGLSKAQRKMLTGDAVTITGTALEAMFKRGLLEGNIAHVVITNLGMEVRAALESSDAGA